MNERIKDLAEQAELPVIDGMWDYNDREILRREDGEWRVATPAEIISLLFACEKGREKFAQLIVRECADLVKDFYREDEFTCYSAETEIKEHFGVEESLGWVCSKCGTDRTKAVCPLGNSAAIDGRCPMVLTV